ncbi:cupin domain-containing protein [Pseudoxanthomonas suwonensis]|uniref:ribosomal protein uL16 3-hydroxylase n=1 Tax=Pseudoxanthomonas suwonensis TaxID=314722 RepID=UPI0004B59560
MTPKRPTPKKTAGKAAAKRAPTALPFEIDAAGRGPLGMDPAQFLRDYWHKRPLLVRNAFPGFQAPLMPEDLAGLACEEGALARLISLDRASGRWDVRHGPFQEEDFPGMPDHDWTLLVQDVDRWDPDVAALLEQFRFLPRWRIDDIMVSFAATGGSVGAHVDHYDVFLLQAHGHRRWMIDASVAMGRPAPDLAFQEDVAIKLLKHFDPTHDWVLGPGDMLYLPPLVPHHGVAEDPCLTFSVGMRAPSSAELMGDWLDEVLQDADEAIRYHDEDLAVPADPNEIDVAAMNRVVDALNAIRMNDPDRLGDWFGRFITTYRAAGDVVPRGDERPRIELEWDLAHGGALERHPWARMAWRRNHGSRHASLFCSGRTLHLPVADARLLADSPVLDGAAWDSLSAAGRDAVFELHQAGFYALLGEDPDECDEDA